MTAWFGLLLLPLVGVLMVSTGLPAFLVLIFAAGVGAIAGIIAGDGALLGALPTRLNSLLESDLLQALPLFVLMGTLINRLPLADILFRSGCRITGRARLSALGLGALLAPMNGSVGASVSVMSRSVRPMLEEERIPAPERVALLAAASTLGVVVPPSLVLIFLGDAMLGAHTFALNATKRMDLAINTQDIFRAALGPALMTLALWAVIAWWQGRNDGKQGGAFRTTSVGEMVAAVLAASFILLLLGGVATGYFYAVEAAAMGCGALLVSSTLTGHLKPQLLHDVLKSALAVSGALFALLVAATTFTLILRILGTDALLTQLLAALPGDANTAIAAALVIIIVSALVLDAFEIIFVIVPIIMPGVLIKAPDAAWVAALTILTLQASFLIPPVGYAIMMTRSGEPDPVASGPLFRALIPYMAALIAIIALTIAFPSLTHLLDRASPVTNAPVLTEQEISKRFQLPQQDLPPFVLSPPKID
jgi:tripartite ATP-independent transporter DctM subunit